VTDGATRAPADTSGPPLERPRDRPLVMDIHAHHFPVGLGDWAQRTGDARWPSLVLDPANISRANIMRGQELFRVVRAACFDASARIADMDAAGVDCQVISPVPVTLIDWAQPGDASAFIAAQNDLLAEVARVSKGRLLAMGTVPLLDTELALRELARAVDELHLSGIEITGMVDGRELDDPAFEPFWAACACERVPVLIHPAHQEVTTRRRGQPYEFGIGMHTDTALAAAALVFGGVLDRHPDLHIALSHGCGAFPWTYPRLRYQARTGDPSRVVALDAHVRRLWADALVFDPLHFRVLVERFGADHILYGTDHPFYPDGLQGPLEVLAEAERSGTGVDERALGANALTFLFRTSTSA
jgi:aminocarboxymuconate-semialdehyde decarboxylase